MSNFLKNWVLPNFNLQFKHFIQLTHYLANTSCVQFGKAVHCSDLSLVWARLSAEFANGSDPLQGCNQVDVQLEICEPPYKKILLIKIF